MKLSDEQIHRYSRQLILNEIGPNGQQKILNSKILVVGAGGLGSPALMYLAAAGVGTIGIADGDRVDLSNLQRQIIHFTEDLRREKVESARDTIRAINPDITVRLHGEFLFADNIEPIISEYDFVIDGSDNFATKFLINDACVLNRKPFSHGGILRFTGQTMTVIPGRSACYRCLFREPPAPGSVPTCVEAGILGSVAGILGSIQATEALKFVTGSGTLIENSLLVFDALDMDFRKITIPTNRDCPICGEAPSILSVRDEERHICEI
jgi:adenylyltransferase/sulfurtransferase